MYSGRHPRSVHILHCYVRTNGTQKDMHLRTQINYNIPHLKIKLIFKICFQFRNLNSLLLHCIAIAHSNSVVIKGIIVLCDAECRPDFILSAVSFSDCTPVIIFTVVVFAEFCIHSLCSIAKLL